MYIILYYIGTNDTFYSVYSNEIEIFVSYYCYLASRLRGSTFNNNNYYLCAINLPYLVYNIVFCHRRRNANRFGVGLLSS